MRTHLTGSVQLKTAIANCAWLCRGLVILLSSLSTLDAQTPPPVVVAQENPVFYIQEYRVKGATKISSLEVEEAVYPYLGPGRTADDVEQARLALEKSFHDKGYQTVSVLIPQQDPRYGVISLEVVEGTVGRLTVNNSKWFLPSKIRAASPSMAEGGVPNMNDVQREILALNRLADRRVTVSLDRKAKAWAAEKGYDPVFGARPLKRFLQRNIETKLARALISGEIAEGGDVKFSVQDDALVMK